MSDWQPKVGEECLLSFNYGDAFKAKITYMGDGVGCFIDMKSGNEYTFAMNSVDFKKLPTEEEKLIEEFINDYRYIAYPADCPFEVKGEFIARAMLNKGYRKVEPIDYDSLLRLCVSKSPTYVCDYLIENNHIVVKGE